MTKEQLQELMQSIPVFSTDEIGIDLSEEDDIYYEEEFD